MPESANRVSIQLALDGHSFSVTSPTEAFANAARVEVELLTPRTMLVPAGLADPAQAAVLLAAHGMSVGADESVVGSLSGQGIAALMAMPTDALRQIRAEFGPRVFFTTPLLHEPPAGEPTVWMCRRADLLYIKVYDGTLRFAEVIRAADEADILYFFERLAVVFPPADFTLRLAGDERQSLRRLLGRIFHDVLCE